MEWLNYHHLQYFWAVARYGSVVRASAELRLAQPTIIGQIRRLEDVLGEKLFDRVGRNLVLTDVGRTVFSYADEIFSLGHDLLGAMNGHASARPMTLTVGVSGALPKALVRRLLAPAFLLGKPLQLTCRNARAADDFLAARATPELHLVLSDRPIGPGLNTHADNHLLGTSGTTFFAAAELARTCRDGFPKSLDGVPFLMPGADAAIRRDLDQWCVANDVRPKTIAEFDDSGTMFAFGEEGGGVFPGPTVCEDEIRRCHNVEVVGRVRSLRQEFYAIAVDRRAQHPGVKAIVEAARTQVFGEAPPVIALVAAPRIARPKQVARASKRASAR